MNEKKRPSITRLAGNPHHAVSSSFCLTLTPFLQFQRCICQITMLAKKESFYLCFFIEKNEVFILIFFFTKIKPLIA